MACGNVDLEAPRSESWISCSSDTECFESFTYAPKLGVVFWSAQRKPARGIQADEAVAELPGGRRIAQAAVPRRVAGGSDAFAADEELRACAEDHGGER